jgi:hypothetical protein
LLPRTVTVQTKKDVTSPRQQNLITTTATPIKADSQNKRHLTNLSGHQKSSGLSAMVMQKTLGNQAAQRLMAFSKNSHHRLKDIFSHSSGNQRTDSLPLAYVQRAIGYQGTQAIIARSAKATANGKTIPGQTDIMIRAVGSDVTTISSFVIIIAYNIFFLLCWCRISINWKDSAKNKTAATTEFLFWQSVN